MIILAIDSSGLTASAAVVSGEKTLAETSADCRRDHSETLMPMTAEVLERAGLTVGDVDLTACSNGPGSFTGLRIGAATIKGLSFAAGKRVVPVPTLDALAYNVFGFDGIVVPIMDARRGQVYSALYEGGTRLTDMMCEDIKTVARMAAERGGAAAFLGDGVSLHESYLRNELPRAVFVPPHLNRTRAAAVGALAMERADEAVSEDKLEVIYIRMNI